jgi:hypothetical protein
MKLMEAVRLVDAERIRQQEVEGYTIEHDDAHETHDLVRAAMIYLYHGTPIAAIVRANGSPMGWPWEAKDFKPKDRKSNLVRAGALLVAERDRLIRENPSQTTSHVNHKLQLVYTLLCQLD